MLWKYDSHPPDQKRGAFGWVLWKYNSHRGKCKDRLTQLKLRRHRPYVLTSLGGVAILASLEALLTLDSLGELASLKGIAIQASLGDLPPWPACHTPCLETCLVHR